VLHAHLPFVRHPDYPRFLEEEWLFEALSESYLPLIEALEHLAAERIAYRITLSISPPLSAMLTDELLMQRYVSYLHERLDALDGERRRAQRHDPDLLPVIGYYEHRYVGLMNRFVHRDSMDITRALRRLVSAGHVELITTAATHGYLPLLALRQSSAWAQLATGIASHERIFGHRPRGFWLPECGFRPGLEHLLADLGIEYFFLETHGLLKADPRPKYGIHRPVRCAPGPVAFARDFESSKQVWSAHEGFPGSPQYREFYWDAGMEIDAPHFNQLRHAGMRTFTGLKYRAIGRPGDSAALYQPERAAEQARVHAQQFVDARQVQTAWLNTFFDVPPVIVAPYDAELFGHWWFEGPIWLEEVLRRTSQTDLPLRSATARSVLDESFPLQTVQPAESSWGAGGMHEIWLNPKTDWIYPLLYVAGERMENLARQFPRAQGWQIQVLNQAARELLLAQSSDWPFVMSTGTSVTYATERLRAHLAQFNELADMLDRDVCDESVLARISASDNIFPRIDYTDFAGRIAT